jgi:hypothetical protein
MPGYASPNGINFPPHSLYSYRTSNGSGFKPVGCHSVDSVLTDLAQGAFKLAMQLLQQPADAHDVLQEAAIVAVSHPTAPLRLWRYSHHSGHTERNRDVPLAPGQAGTERTFDPLYGER